MRSLAFFLSIFAAALGAHADVVRCTDASGAISYTNVACPPGSKQARPVQILTPPPPDETRRDDVPPAPVATPQQPPRSQVAGNRPNPPSAPAVIPRYPPDTQPAADPPPVYILGPDPDRDPYYDGVRPIRRPPPHLRDPGPPPGKRPCQNLAGIQRSNC
ncbi:MULTISPECIES: hypothetical protein [unclassified Variovorax]|uniref:hypothetical protein n=1 Tax=unclassified Variovorax TaxID=663243 RepID=UPI003F44F4C2